MRFRDGVERFDPVFGESDVELEIRVVGVSQLTKLGLIPSPGGSPDRTNDGFPKCVGWEMELDQTNRMVSTRSIFAVTDVHKVTCNVGLFEYGNCELFDIVQALNIVSDLQE